MVTHTAFSLGSRGEIQATIDVESSLHEKLGRILTQGPGNRLQDMQTRLSASPMLDVAHIGAADSGLHGKILLAHAPDGSPLPHPPTKCGLRGSRVPRRAVSFIPNSRLLIHQIRLAPGI